MICITVMPPLLNFLFPVLQMHLRAHRQVVFIIIVVSSQRVQMATLDGSEERFERVIIFVHLNDSPR